MKSGIVLLAVALAFPSLLGAAPASHDYAPYTHWEAGFLTSGDDVTSVTTCSIQGTPCFATTGLNSGLTMFSLGSGAVTQEGGLPLAGTSVDVTFDGDVAYVVSKPNRLARVLVFVPSAPFLTWEATLPATPEAVAMLGSRVLIACGSGGLLVFDPTIMFGNPVGVVASWAGAAHDLRVQGNLAYVRTGTGLAVIDFSDPLHPLERGSLGEANAVSLAVAGNTVWLGRTATPATGGRLTRLDVSNPDLPVATGSWTDLGDHDVTALSLADTVLVTAGSGDLEILASGGGSVLWNGVGGNFPEAAACSGDLVGVAHGAGGFQVYRRGVSTFPPASPVFGVGSSLLDLQVAGSHAFGHAGGAVYCFDLAPTVPQLAWTYTPADPSAFVTALFATTNRVFVGYLSGRVEILDHDGLAATPRGSLDLGGEGVLDLGLAGGALAVQFDPVSDGFIQAEARTYDLTDVAAPVMLDSYRDDDHPNMLASGNSLVLWDDSINALGVRILDASIPGNLTPAAAIGSPALSRVSRQGDHIYVLAGLSLQAHDITDPFAPLPGPITTIPGGSVFVPGTGAGYLAGTDMVFDLSDPLRPAPLGSYSTPVMQGAARVAVGDGYLVLGQLADMVLLGSQGQALTPVEPGPVPGLSPVDLQAAPNPFNPMIRLAFAVPADGRARVEVFDLRGRRVMRLDGIFSGRERASVVWDGRTEAGREVPSGMYLVKVSSALGTGSRQITLVR